MSLLLRSLAIATLLLAGRGRAAADGAFPNSDSIMTPSASPHAIVLGTNFGVVSSADDGATWTWSCEQAETSFASFYQLGAPPRDRLYAIGAEGLVYSDDGSCSWRVAGGTTAGGTMLDAFPDPSTADRVLAIVTRAGDGGAAFELIESNDGGATFGAPRYATAGDRLTGVEIARSAPLVAYLTMLSGSASTPRLARSPDGGQSWQPHDLGAMLGPGTAVFRLVAIDPADAMKVFLRVGNSAGERLAVTADGGASVATPLALPGGVLTAFVRMPSGSLIVTGKMGVDPVAFRSLDGGASFEALPSPPYLRGLSARGTTLFAIADTMMEDFTVATSNDEGTSWQPLMRPDQIRAIQSCVMAQCQVDCLSRADTNQWPPEFCAATAPAMDASIDAPADAAVPPDARDGAAGGSGGAGAGGGGNGGNVGSTGGGGGGGAVATSASGCHCAVSGGPAVASSAAALVTLIMLMRRKPRRRQAKPQ